MLPVRPELIRPGIEGIRPVPGFIGPESEFVRPELVRLPSDVEGVPLEAEIGPHEAEVIPQVDGPNMMDWEASLCKSFSVKEKHEYVVAIDALMAEGASRRQACSMVGLPHNYYP